MSIYRVQVRIPGVSNTSADIITNTWHIDGNGAGLISAMQSIKAFYNTTAPGNSAALINYMSSGTITGNWRAVAYDLADPEPRTPVRDETWTVLVGGGNPAPAECAVAFSYQGARLSGTPQARRRGRLFLGPWGTAQIAGNGRVSGLLQASIARCGKELITQSDAATDWSWVVWSPTDAAAVPILNGWVDDAWDTVRSRGPKPSARTLYSLTTP